MNTEITARKDVRITVAGYSDGIYNLEIYTDDRGEMIEVSKDEAQRLCDLLDVNLPDPEPTPPEQWG